MIKFNRRKLLNAGAAVNLALSLLYVLAVVMMFRHVSFKLGGGEHVMSINFLPPTATRIFNWSLLCLASLFVSVVLFADGFSNKLIKYAAIAIAVFLAGCELINFFAPLLRHLSRHIKKMEGLTPFRWNAIYTLNLSVFVIRLFVALISLILAPWKDKNTKSAPSN